MSVDDFPIRKFPKCLDSFSKGQILVQNWYDPFFGRAEVPLLTHYYRDFTSPQKSGPIGSNKVF